MDVAILAVLLFLSCKDKAAFQIPNWCNMILLLFGIAYGAVHPARWGDLLAGCLGFGGLLFVLYMITGGRILGAGDIKLMAAAGLRLGFDKTAMAFLIGAGAGCGIQWFRRKFMEGESYFPLGPWLSLGISMMILKSWF